MLRSIVILKFGLQYLALYTHTKREACFMIIFFICITILILGYKFYSPFVEKQAGMDTTVDTPQKRFSEGVDYVAIHPVRAFLIQFLFLFWARSIFVIVYQIGRIYLRHVASCRLLQLFSANGTRDSNHAKCVHQMLQGLVNI